MFIMEDPPGTDLQVAQDRCRTEQAAYIAIARGQVDKFYGLLDTFDDQTKLKVALNVSKNGPGKMGPNFAKSLLANACVAPERRKLRDRHYWMALYKARCACLCVQHWSRDAEALILPSWTETPAFRGVTEPPRILQSSCLAAAIELYNLALECLKLKIFPENLFGELLHMCRLSRIIIPSELQAVDSLSVMHTLLLAMDKTAELFKKNDAPDALKNDLKTIIAGIEARQEMCRPPPVLALQ